MLLVAQVFCVHSEPNYSLPWQRKRQFSSTGSGFIIPGRRILTNAHCVDHHSQVKVRRRGSDTKVRRKVSSAYDASMTCSLNLCPAMGRRSLCTG